MSDDYATAIHKAFQGEVYGEALFRGLAERTTDAARAYKWRVLERLETETKERIRPLAEQLCGEVGEEASERERGEKDAAKFSPIPWPSLMGGFRNELLNFVASFEELEAAGPDEDRGLLQQITAHERALLAFAEREVDGRGDASLDPVLDLLDEPPPRS
jgi:hypothetical protein